MENTIFNIMINDRKTRISAIYKNPSQLLPLSDIEKPLNSNIPTISSCDLNSKHLNWNSRSITNPTGRSLFSHMYNNDYYITAPITPTYFPDQFNYNLNVYVYNKKCIYNNHEKKLRLSV